MKTLILSALTFFVASSAWAQSPGTQIENIQHKIDEAVTASDNLRSSLRTTFEIKKLSFPDYPGAYDQFISDAEKVLGEMKTKYLEIERLVNTKHSENLTKLESTRKYAREEPSRVNLELLRIEEERFKQETRELEKELNVIYKTALRQVYSLSGRLIYPIRLTQNNFLEKIGGGRDVRKSHYDARAAAVFGNCKTSGCALTMAEHYGEWLKHVASLNQSIDLTPGLSLDAIAVVGQDSGKDALWELAKYYAKAANLETAVFGDSN